MQKFCNLSSLHFNFGNQALKILAAIGPQLKVLEIRSSFSRFSSHPKVNPFYDLLKIFVLCPILEKLYVHSFSGTVDLNVPVDVQKLKLEKLRFILGDFSSASEFLCLILAAPCLTSVEMLHQPTLSNQIIESLSSLLANNSVLQNLIKFDLQLGWPWGSRDLANSLNKHLVAFCPKLLTAHVYTWSCYPRSESVPESIAPFVDLVQNI